jgi:hypothetical protein
MRGTLCLAALFLFAAIASAQRTLFLVPESDRIAPGAALRVRLESDAKPAPWPETCWVYVRAGDTQENLDSPPAADSSNLVTLPCSGTGPSAVGVDFRPVVERIDADTLRAFTKSHCEDPLPVDITGELRLRRIQSCKAIVRIGDGPGTAAISETSQAADISLRIDPARLKLGSDLALSISLRGTDLEDARITATPPSGKPVTLHSEDEGAARIPITAPGLWRIEFHRLTKSTDPDADWDLTTGTLTFTIPGAKP